MAGVAEQRQKPAIQPPIASTSAKPNVNDSASSRTRRELGRCECRAWSLPVPMALSTAARGRALLIFAVLYLPWLVVDFSPNAAE